MEPKDDMALIVERAQRLEPEAFDELVERYAPRLYGLLCKLIGTHRDVEDLVQEVFVRVVKNIGGYQHDGRFDSWLFRIATNLARDHIRKRVRTPELFSLEQDDVAIRDGSTAPPSGGSSEQNEPGLQLVKEEEAGRLRRAIAELPTAEREVILLRQYSEMTFSEIANMMGTPIGTALARAHRALSKLRTWMEAGDEHR